MIYPRFAGQAFAHLAILCVNRHFEFRCDLLVLAVRDSRNDIASSRTAYEGNALSEVTPGNPAAPGYASSLREVSFAIEGLPPLFTHTEAQLPHVKSMLRLDQTAKSDNRSYLYAELSNGIKVLSIQDIRTEQVSFALAALAGSYDEPRKLPGLAHFCEHMLFLGSEKFPYESNGTDFDTFIGQRGGYSNAWTEDENTVYYVEVPKFSGRVVMDRFADFFRAPLFCKECVHREVQAVDGEHHKNIQSPSWRVQAVWNALAADGSLTNHFSTGDISTLETNPKAEGIDVVGELKRYFEEHYCPERMILVTFAAASTTEQLRNVSDEFARISRSCTGPDRNASKPSVPAWPSNNLGKWVDMKGKEPHRYIKALWPFPDVRKEFLSRPLEYIQYILMYGGEDSLSRVLRDSLGIVNSFSVDYDASWDGSAFTLSAQLTPKGYKQPWLVLDVFFAFMAKVRRLNVSTALYQSIADVNFLEWDWAQAGGPSSTSASFASAMTDVPPEHLLEMGLIKELKPELVKELLERITPEHMNVLYVSSKKEGDDKKFFQNEFNHENRTPEKVPHYGVEYLSYNLSARLGKLYEEWSSWLQTLPDDDALERALSSKLSAANITPVKAVVPVHPSVIKDVPQEDESFERYRKAATWEAPEGALCGPPPVKMDISTGLQLAFDGKTSGVNGHTKIWYRKGWVNTSPRAKMSLNFRALEEPNAPEKSALDNYRVYLYNILLHAQFAPKMAEFSTIGMGYDIGVNSRGVHLSVDGYVHLIPTVLKKLTQELSLPVDVTHPNRYPRHLKKIQQDLEDYSGNPIGYASQDLGLLLVCSDGHSREERKDALEQLTPELVGSTLFEVTLTQKMQLTGLAMGNVDAANAETVFRNTVDEIQQLQATSLKHGEAREPSPDADVRRFTKIVNIKQPIEVRKSNQRHDDKNEATIVEILHGVQTLEHSVISALLDQVVSSFAYKHLRTELQLGYIVSATVGSLENINRVRVAVQGTKKRPDEVEATIEHMLRVLVPQELNKLDNETFAEIKDAYEHQLIEPPTAYSQESGSFSYGIMIDRPECFYTEHKLLHFLRSGLKEKQPLLDAWQELIGDSQLPRQKVTIKYFRYGEPVPKRPDAKTVLQNMQAAGIKDQVHLDALSAEYEKTNILSKVDSLERSKLVKAGGHFNTTVYCDLQPASQDILTGGHPKTPQEVRPGGQSDACGHRLTAVAFLTILVLNLLMNGF